MLNNKNNQYINLHFFISAFIVFLLAQSSYAVETSRFTHYTAKNGLAHNYTFVAFQDKSGFMWFGTMSGLSRFDGYHFTNYHHIPSNKNSLSDDIVTSITEDNQGNLWIGTNSGGLNHLNINSQKIKHYLYQENNPNSVRTNTIKSLYIDNNRLWIGTSAGLDILNTENDQFTHLNLTLNSGKSISERAIYGISPIGDHLWLTTKSGIVIYDTLQHRTSVIKHNPNSENSLKSDNVFTIFQDHKHEIWVGSNGGLNKINPQTLQLTSFKLPSYNSTIKSVLAITEDDEGRLWAATSTNGLYQISNDRLSIKHYLKNPYINDTLSDNTVKNLLIDKNQVLWAISASNGINKLDLQSEQFNLHRNLIGQNELIDSPINNIYEDPDGFLWILQETITRYNPLSGQYDNPIKSIKNYDDIKFKKIYAIAGRGYNLWLTTESYGLIHYNIKQKKIIYFQSENSHLHGLIEKHLHGIFTDNENLWIDSVSGFYQYDNSKNRFTLLPFAPAGSEKLIYGQISNVITDHKKNIWIATADGLFQIEADHVVKQHISSTKDNSLSHNVVYDILADSNHNLWIATQSGLNKYNYNTQTFDVLTTEHGLPGNSIVSLLMDNTNTLWAGTNQGLARISTQTNNIVSFHENNGLQSELFLDGARIKTKQGLLVFGGTKGFNIFNPAEIKQKIAPDVRISELHLLNKKTPIAELQVKNDSNNHDKNQITLEHQQNDISFTLSSMDYFDPPSILYRFKLDGYHNKWINRDASNRVASFTNLNHGTYHLDAQASYDNINWSEQKNLLTITILPPWWFTIYAYIGYIILSIGFIFIIVRLQTYRLKHKAQVLEKVVNERTQQIQQQKSLIEEQASHLQILIKKKDQVFSHISHEFRTPLTLILGPLKSLFHVVSETQQKSIELVQTNAYRLLRLVDQLLELSKLHAQQDSSEVKEKNTACTTNSLIKAILPSFQVLAENKSITLQLSHHDHCHIACSYDSLEKIITNLLSNAIKYTLEGGEITLSISNKDETQCEINVKDNGLGIPDDQQNTIFEPFTRVENHQQRESIPGTGIGLSLVKELVETNDGSVKLTSRLGKGSHFSVTLPLADVEKQIIYQKNQHIDEMNLDIIDLSNRIQQELSPGKESQLSNNDVVIDEKQPVLLIIEDNPEMRQYIQDLCSPHYQCLLAGDGKQGAQLAIDYIPDIILSDIMMPELDGHGCLKLLKADRRTCHIPVILLSALKDRENRIQGLEEKADDVLTKPFDSEELLIRLKNLLAIRDLLKQSTTNDKNFGIEITDKEKINKSNISELDQMFLQHFDQMLNKYYTEEELNLETMAQHLLLSDRQMQRKLKALTGSNPSEYLRDFRLSKAAERFRIGYGVENVAYQVGFSSRSYFSKCFKAKYKMTAKQYQQQFATQTDLK